MERYVHHEHAPPHLFSAGATYFVTAKMLDGRAFMHAPARRQQLLDALQFAANRRGWLCVAWVVLSNHYHCILKAPAEGADALPVLLASVHKFTARRWNEEDGAAGRQIWYQYWDTCLTSLGSFYARLNYLHWNPVRHGICARPEDYPFSSYSIWRKLEEVDLAEIEEAYPWERLELE